MSEPYKIVILSARAENLVPCVRAIRAQEPDLPADHVVVVDDGARDDARGGHSGGTRQTELESCGV